jgi:hypothetical protein
LTAPPRVSMSQNAMERANHKGQAAPADDESRLDDNLLPPRSNLYSEADLRRVSEAIAACRRIKKECTIQREDWLTVIGPTLVMVRDKVLEMTGSVCVAADAYRKAIRPELERIGFTKDVIRDEERSYLLRIMDNLSDVEAWLSTVVNPDRLNHPKTIWQAYWWEKKHRVHWDDDDDPDDVEKYWSLEDEPDDDDDDDVTTANTTTDDEDEDEERRIRRRSGHRKSRSDETTTTITDTAADDNGAATIPDMPERDISTIGELKEYIEEAIRKGASPDNKFYIRHNDDEDIYLAKYVSFCDSDGPDDPPFMTIVGEDNAHYDDEEDDDDDEECRIRRQESSPHAAGMYFSNGSIA